MYKNLQSYQHLVKIEEIIEAKDIRIAQKKEREEEQKKKEEEEAKKFKPFTGKGYMVDQPHVLDEGLEDDDEDDEIKKVMKLSLQEYAENALKSLPPEPEKGGYSIMVNYNGKFFKRNFNEEDKIGHIVTFVKSQIPTYSKIQLFESFPKVTYDNEDLTIKESGLSRNQMLMCRIIN